MLYYIELVALKLNTTQITTHATKNTSKQKRQQIFNIYI